MHKRLLSIYTKTWGQSLPGFRQGTIYNYEILPNGRCLPNDNHAGAMLRDNKWAAAVEDLLAEHCDGADTYGGAAVDFTIPESFEYDCHAGITEIVQALELPAELEDVLVVRNEYKWLLDLIENGQLKNAQAIVLTGHPGIGKTTFLLYALLRCLQRKLPSAFQLPSGRYVIFDEHGVLIRNGSFSDDRLKGCMALCDGDEPCTAFQSSYPKHVIQATPPTTEMRHWLKENLGTTVVLDLPNVLEIAAILKELTYDFSRTLYYVRKWGPCTRTIVDIAQETQVFRQDPAAVEQALERAAEKTAQKFCQRPASLFLSLGGMTVPTSECSSLVFIRPIRCIESITLKHLALVVSFIPTKYLCRVLDCSRKQSLNLKSLQLFYVFSSHPYTRGVFGWGFEKAVHERLCIDRQPLSIFRANGTKDMMVAPSTRLLSGTLAGLSTAQKFDSFYWIPSVTNFPGIDSVLGDGRNIFAIQATIASSHTSPVEGLQNVWDHLPADMRKNRKWHVVIVSDGPREKVEKLVYECKRQLLKAELKFRVRAWGCVLVN